MVYGVGQVNDLTAIHLVVEVAFSSNRCMRPSLCSTRLALALYTAISSLSRLLRMALR